MKMPKPTGMNRKSEVWNFFTIKNNQNCICNLCGRIYKSGGGTTNLKNHLLHKHPSCSTSNTNIKSNCDTESRSSDSPKKKQKTKNIETENEKEIVFDPQLDNSDLELQVLESPDPDNEDRASEMTDMTDLVDSPSPTLTNHNQRPGSSTSTSSTKSKSTKTSSWIQPTIDAAFKEKRSYEVGGSKEASITQALVFMICKDNYPLSCTEKEGLRKFLKVAVPLYQPPSRSTITKRVNQKYVSLKKVVSLKLLNAVHLALTTDIATVMNATRSFIVLTAHCIDDEKAAMISIALGVKNLTPHHTGDNICQDLQEMLEDWNIPTERIVSITTDNGANIVSGAKKLMEGHTANGLDIHVSCFAHNINLVVSKALGCKEVEVIVQIIEKVKRIVAYFKHSNVAQDELRKEQQKEGKKDGTYLYLIQEVPTRWNATFYCLERFILLSGHVGKILSSPVHKTAPPMVTPTELGIIQEILILLRPFEAATKTISGEKYVSGSLVIPLINCVKTSLERIVVTNPNVLCKSLKTELLAQITKRLDPLEKNILLSAATILDPRFKRIHFSSPLNAASAISTIKTEVKKELRLQGSVTPPIDQNNTDDERGGTLDCSIWSIHEEVASKNLPDLEISEGIPTELKLYLNQPIQPRNRDPIQYWTESRFAFPATYKSGYEISNCTWGISCF